MADRDLDVCRGLLQRKDRRLFAAGVMLPPRVRDALTPLFAFFWAAMDEASQEGTAPGVIDELRRRVDAIYTATPRPIPVDRALTKIVEGYGLPRAVFDWFLEGLAWDVDGRRYATDGALLDYAVRTAGTVGVAASLVMGRARHVVLDRACDLALAIKLTTIARDVGEDARRGRLYLPIEWLEEAGVDVDLFLEHPTPSAGVRNVVGRLLQSADAFYKRADPGILALPIACRPAVRAGRYLFSALGDEIERAGCDSVSRTVDVSTPRAARLALRAFRASRSESRAIDQSRLESAERLVAAVSG